MGEGCDRAPVTVVLAVYRPDHEHLNAQIQSLRAQSHPISRLVAVIADRSSVALVRDATACGDWSVDYVVPELETSSFKSFELGLKRAIEVSSKGAVFALCDQDDVWNHQKIEKSVRALVASGASLVHTDARLIENGSVVAPSLFRRERRVRDDGPRALLLRNSVTGMTCAFTWETAQASLPFPPQSALFFHHDLWLALVASVLRGINRLNDPLVDYRQHSANVVGAVMSRRQTPRLLSRAWLRHWLGSYSVAVYLAKSLYLRMQEVEAAGTSKADTGRLAGLSPYLAPRAFGGRLIKDGLKWALRGRFFHARQSAMFGCVQLARMVWSLRRCLKSGTLQSLAAFDAKAFAQAPGSQPGAIAPESGRKTEVWDAKAMRDDRTLRSFGVAVQNRALKRIVILVPSLNPAEIFAGIATAIDIGLGLAARGHRVVFVATDLPIASRARTTTFIKERASKTGTHAQVSFEIFCGVTEPELVLSPNDQLLATAWWSAHIASGIIHEFGLNDQKFIYLIQDYEPGFYAWGPEFAAAEASYHLKHVPVFNSSPLRDFFRQNGLADDWGPDLCFHPAISVPHYAKLRRPVKERPRLVVYGRPEVARNLFSVTVEALDAFLHEAEVSPPEIELLSVGLKHPDVQLGNGHRLVSLGKIPWDDYPEFLAGVDIGVSLMLSPHPSHPPIEMAAAGARVVTNRFLTKDLSALGGGVISVAPTAREVTSALVEAWRLPPVTSDERDICLLALGRPMNEMLDDLSSVIGCYGVRRPTRLAKAS